MLPRPQASQHPQLTVEEILRHLVEPHTSSQTPELRRDPIPSSVDTAQSHTTAIEQALKAMFPQISLHVPQTTMVEVQSAPTTCTLARSVEEVQKPAPSAPTVSSNASSTDNAVRLEQSLKSLFSDSVQAKAGSPVPSSSQGMPETKMVRLLLLFNVFSS